MPVQPPAGLKLKAQIYLGADIAMGPGKADLLEAIAATGSISAAGRHMGLSYRRAWLLVDTMNRCFAEPLVSTAHGGVRGGGAALTRAGEIALELYRRMDRAATAAASLPAAELSALLKPKAD